MLSNSTANFSLPSKNFSIIYYFVPIYAILFLIGAIGNGLVFIILVRSTRLRTVTNTYLLNIAIADFLLLLSIPFLIITILANGWIFGNMLCKMYYNFIHINQYVSSLLLAALSFDRYLAVCHPVRAIQFRTRNKCALVIAGCWLVSVLLLCPTWVFARVTSDYDIFWFGLRVERCVIDFPAVLFTIAPEIAFTYYAFFFGFLLPVSMITTFYILVLIRLQRIRRKHTSEFRKRSHRRVTRVVLAVITAYIICWVPYWFLQIFITLDPLIDSLYLKFSLIPTLRTVGFLRELTHLTTIFGYANNCLNPFLYVFLSETFREEYILILDCFHLNALTRKTRQSNQNIESLEDQLNRNSKQASVTNSRPKRLTKNVRSNCDIDDIPSEYRTYPFRFNYSLDSKRKPILSKTQSVRSYDARNTVEYLPMFHGSSKSKRSALNEKSNYSLRTQLTVRISNEPTNNLTFPNENNSVYSCD